MKTPNKFSKYLDRIPQMCYKCGRFHDVNSDSQDLSVNLSDAVTKGLNHPRMLSKNSIRRRQFLLGLAGTSALGVLSNCAASPDANSQGNSSGVMLEKTQLRIGFLPIACATPILICESLNLYEKYGLDVELVKMNSWEQIRESAIAGELDAYHMLSPMPIAISLGLESPRFPIRLASIQNINGSAITVAIKHREKVKTAEDFKGFRIAVPFTHSMHNLLLRYYLANSKVHPDRDVEVVVIPPPNMLNRLRSGEIDAMVAPEPFNQIAINQGLGFIHLLTRDLWPGHPCCSFTTSQEWIDRYPNTFRAINKAIIEGSYYASQSQNRTDVARRLAQLQYLDASEDVLRQVMTGQFVNRLGQSLNIPDRIDFDPYPWKSFSYWITSQFERWGYFPLRSLNHEAIAANIFLTGLARQMAKQLGQQPPTITLRYESLKFDTFDPSEPENYAIQQIEKFGF
ncbi:ABC transporter substrate-binding protein [Limnospira fusiformis]|uniref:ABC transporter substrate-binding protein n=1 Tax=Limnospira fusiformis TaxID=54297 RepID=UPI002AA14C6D|nr:ABC transporter substrate-binding protein [Limnospira fusiformis LS22]